MAGGESRIIVHGGQVVTAAGTGPIDVVIADGVVAELAAPGAADRSGAELIDASGLVVLPGVVDAHTHFIQDDPDLFDPDPDEHEGFEAGGRGAAAGGVTTVVEMPQARPPTVDGATFERKRALAAPGAVVDFALWGGVVQSTTAEQIDEQIGAGAAGLKAFMCNSDPSFPGVDDDRLLAALTHLAPTGLMLGVHAESDTLLEAGLARMQAEGRKDPLAHHDSRPPVVEVEAVSRAIVLAEAAGAWVHIVHLSCGAAADAVARAKARGVRVTCETCPQYLALDHDDLARLGPFARCAPPIRSRADVEHLWERLADGTIDCITTDHCAFTYESRTRGADDIFAAPNGLPGIETFVPVVVTEARVRGFGWDDDRPLDGDHAGGALAARAAQGRRRARGRRRPGAGRPGQDLGDPGRRPAPHPQVDAVRAPRGDRPGGADARARDDGLPGWRGGRRRAWLGPVHPRAAAGARGGDGMSPRILLVNPNATAR